VDDDVTWLTNPHYLSAGNHASFNGFLARSSSWSYGFIAAEDIPDDFLGRVMFCRDGGNYIGFKDMNSTYGYLFYGKNSTSRYYNATDSTIGVINAGQHVIATFNGTTFNLYVNGVLKDTASISSSYMETAATNDIRDLFFGRSVNSNVDLGVSVNQYQGHAYWQGLIEQLWIANGVELSSTQVTEISGQTDIALSTNYSSITHYLLLDETDGKNFVAIKGGVDFVGEKVTS
jgi:hypothetical protein